MVYDLVGWLGALLILVAYALASSKRISVSSRTYHIINLIGATGIILNTFSKKVIPAMALNVVWAFIAIYSLLKIKKSTRN